MASPVPQSEGCDEHPEFDLADRAEAGVPPARYLQLTRNTSRDGILPLIEAGFADETASSSPLSCYFEREHTPEEFWKMWFNLCDQFLLSLPSAALAQLISGNIDLAYRNSQAANGALAKYIGTLAHRGEVHPACYVRPLTDDNGASITLDDLETVLSAAERYHQCDAANTREAYEIDRLSDDAGADTQDCWSQAASTNGARRHLTAKDAQGISPARIKLLEAFIAANRARIAHCRTADSPIEPPIQDVGSATDTKARQKQHDSRSGSGWLSTHIRDICEFKWPGKYSIKFFVICLLTDEPTGPWAEITLSRFLRAYAIDGGLRTEWAANDDDSLTLPEMTTDQSVDYWTGCQDWYRKELGPAIEKRRTIELERRRGLYKSRLEAEAEQVRREGDELYSQMQIERQKALDILNEVRDSGYSEECEAVKSDSESDLASDEDVREHNKTLRLFKKMKRGAQLAIDIVDASSTESEGSAEAE